MHTLLETHFVNCWLLSSDVFFFKLFYGIKTVSPRQSSLEQNFRKIRTLFKRCVIKSIYDISCYLDTWPFRKSVNF